MQSIFFKTDSYGNRKFQMEFDTRRCNQDEIILKTSENLLSEYVCENGILVSLKYYCQSILAHRVEVRESLCYTLGVGVQTWLRFLVQVLYLSYHLSYLHHTCMNESSIPTHGLERPGC